MGSGLALGREGPTVQMGASLSSVALRFLLKHREYAEIVEDAAEMFELGVSVFERYYGAYSEELRPFIETMLHKRIVAKVNVERTVSWDHRKLGLPSTRPA